MSVSPNQAILFHRASVNTNVQTVGHNFATLHDIKVDEQRRPVIHEGKLMSHDCLVSILKEMLDMKQTRSLQLLPENVIAQSDDSLVWHVPGEVRTILYKHGKKTTRMAVPYPSLIFKVTDNSLSIAAYKFKRKPSADDYIYHAPLANIYCDGKVCVGNAKCPDDSGLENIKGWESVIFDSEFTHTNHSQTLEQKGDKETSTEELYNFWKSLRGDKVFPANRLNRMNDTTLQEWLEE